MALTLKSSTTLSISGKTVNLLILRGSTAFIVCRNSTTGNKSVLIYDCSNPASPVLASTIPDVSAVVAEGTANANSSVGYTVDEDGKYFYIVLNTTTANPSYLMVWDCSNIYSPSLVATSGFSAETTPSVANANNTWDNLIVRGDYLYAAGGAFNLFKVGVFNISNKSACSVENILYTAPIIPTINTSSLVKTIGLLNDYFYVVAGYSTERNIMAYDVSTPSSISLLSRSASNMGASRSIPSSPIHFFKNKGYVNDSATSLNPIHIYNCSNKSSPFWEDSFVLTGGASASNSGGSGGYLLVPGLTAPLLRIHTLESGYPEYITYSNSTSIGIGIAGINDSTKDVYVIGRLSTTYKLYILGDPNLFPPVSSWKPKITII